MTNKYRIISLLIALVMCCALFAACGGGGDESTAPESGAQSGTDQSAESAEPASGNESLSPEELYNVYMGDDYEGWTFTVFTSDVDEEALSDIVYNTEAVGGELLPDRMNNALLNRQNTL
ncbi:MAG: hypothetical protein J6W93_08025, partial [Clostridia bacterium]|nr:hypothetical protein [Clostridia bacterium]